MGFVGLLLVLTHKVVKNPSTMPTIILNVNASITLGSLPPNEGDYERAHDAAMHL